MVRVFACVAFAALLLTACGTHREGPRPIPVPTRKSWQEIERTLDHFKIWEVKEIPFTRNVDLRGQFDRSDTTAAITHVSWIANPVEKNGRSVLHKDAHLVGYYLEPPAAHIKRWVRIANQIDTQPTTWYLTDPAMLLLPASKVFSGEPPAPPNSLDHFECYLVVQTKPIAKTVVLQDQFDVLRHVKEKVTQLEPAFFCLPVSKNHSRILDNDAHLALYDISPQAIVTELTIGVKTRDQFNRLDLNVERSILLAVPTEKINWGIVEQYPTRVKFKKH